MTKLSNIKCKANKDFCLPKACEVETKKGQRFLQQAQFLNKITHTLPNKHTQIQNNYVNFLSNCTYLNKIKMPDFFLHMPGVKLLF